MLAGSAASSGQVSASLASCASQPSGAAPPAITARSRALHRCELAAGARTASACQASRAAPRPACRSSRARSRPGSLPYLQANNNAVTKLEGTSKWMFSFKFDLVRDDRAVELYSTGRGNYPAFNVEIIGGRGVITLVHCNRVTHTGGRSSNRPNQTMLSSLLYCYVGMSRATFSSSAFLQ